MTRDSFFARKVATHSVKLSDGGKLKIRKLSQADAEVIGQRYGKPEAALAGNRFIVSRCVVDDDGKRLFSDEDAADKLAEVDFETVAQIAREALRFSGFIVDAPKNG